MHCPPQLVKWVETESLSSSVEREGEITDVNHHTSSVWSALSSDRIPQHSTVSQQEGGRERWQYSLFFIGPQPSFCETLPDISPAYPSSTPPSSGSQGRRVHPSAQCLSEVPGVKGRIWSVWVWGCWQPTGNSPFQQNACQSPWLLVYGRVLTDSIHFLLDKPRFDFWSHLHFQPGVLDVNHRRRRRFLIFTTTILFYLFSTGTQQQKNLRDYFLQRNKDLSMHKTTQI